MKAEYKDKFNLLILLGFICQGFAWENYIMPFLFAGIWFLVLRFRQEEQVISDSIELLIFFLALVFSMRFIGHNAYFRLLAMGNALLVLQAVRLLSPMNRRKQLIAFIIAITHLAVGSQFILDYSFIIILLFAVILIPEVLYRIQSGNAYGVSPLFFADRKVVYPAVCFFMILFFVGFPRRKLVSAKDAGMIMSRGAMRPRVDTVTGGGSLSDRSILRVKGENIKYLRCFALDTFNGAVWSASRSSRVIDRVFDKKYLKKYSHRYVTVMDLTLIGSTLPVDKHVMYLKGNFFQGAHISEQDSVVISMVWPQNINYYEYWTTDNIIKSLKEKEVKKFTSYPDQSLKLQNWLKNLVKNEKNDEKRVQIVRDYLKKKLNYEVGTPDLNRFSPVDDFIFNRKSGHCERFASALALLCRMMKIPSRVVIGYSVPEKNQFADYHNVSVNNGHAWVETFISGKGWQTFDATPFSFSDTQLRDSQFFMKAKDWLDYFWYSKVVEFSSDDQNQLLSLFVAYIKHVISFLMYHSGLITVIVVIVITFYLISKLRLQLKQPSDTADEKHAIQLEAAEKFYTEMLEAMSRKQIHRHINQTPNEFAYCSVTDFPDFKNEINLVTENFCLVKYGERRLTDKQISDSTKAVDKIRGNS